MDPSFHPTGEPNARDSGSGVDGFWRRIRTSFLGTSSQDRRPRIVERADFQGRQPRRLVRSDTSGALAKPHLAETRNADPPPTSTTHNDNLTSRPLRSQSSTGLSQSSSDRKTIDKAIPPYRRNSHVDPTTKRSYSVDRVEAYGRISNQHYCHVCRSRFGLGRECTVCSHTYCKDCIRQPEQLDQSCLSPQSNTTAAKTGTKRRASPYNSFDTPRPPTQTTRKVHRVCHRCSTPFVFSERICQECNHLQCSKCGRRPDSSQLPAGGGGENDRARERMHKKPRQRVRFTCDRCGSLFRERNRRCDGCGHIRCEGCLRAP